MSREELERKLEEDGVAVCPVCLGRGLDPQQVMEQAAEIALENSDIDKYTGEEYSERWVEITDSFADYIQFVDPSDVDECSTCRGTGYIDWITVARNAEQIYRCVR